MIIIERIKYNIKNIRYKVQTKIRINKLKEDEFVQAEHKRQLIELVDSIKQIPIFSDDEEANYINLYNMLTVKDINNKVKKLLEKY